MSIVSVDNIQPIGSGTTVTVNSAATLVLNNANSTGVITATTFVGALTGTASGNPTLGDGSNNRVITATGANALTGESNLTFTGSLLHASNSHIKIDSGYSFQWGDTHERIEQSDGKIEFFTNNTEKVTLSGSNLGIGTDNPQKLLELSHLSSANRKHQFSYDDSILTMKGANNAGNPETMRFIGGNSLRFHTGATGSGTERVRIQDGGLKMNGGSYIVECSEGGSGTTNNNTKIMDQRRWMWYGASSSTHTVARVAKASSGQPGDGDSQLAAWIVTYTARSMYGFNSDGGYSVMKMRTGRFDYNDNEVRFSTEQDTLGTGGGSQNPTIVFTDEGSGVVRIDITNPSSTHSFGEINLMTYDCRITLPSG